MNVLEHPSLSVACLDLGKRRCDRDAASCARCRFVEEASMADAEVTKQSVQCRFERLTVLRFEHRALVLLAKCIRVDIWPHELRVDRPKHVAQHRFPIRLAETQHSSYSSSCWRRLG